MVAIAHLSIAAALAGQSAAQFFGMSPKQILALTKVLPPALVTPEMSKAFNVQVNGKYGKVAESSSNKIPAMQQIAPFRASQVPGSKTVKIRHGPYLVPSMMTKNGLEEGGALWNFPDKDVRKPCETCVVIGIRAGLETEDGTSVNIDSGAWLHHMVLMNAGPGRVDATCEFSPKSLPHINVGMKPKGSERVFASGNERVPLNIDWTASPSGKPAGYHLNPEDRFAMLVDFMNENMEDKTYYLTMTYDYVDGHPAEYDDVRPLWFDIDNCAFSEVKRPEQSGKFTINAQPWTSTVDGEVLGWFGHLHDGGVSVIMEKDGKVDCSSDAAYGTAPGFVQKQNPMGMSADSALSHISNMTLCDGGAQSRTMMKPGQVWTLKAAYDYGAHKGMRDDDGTQAEIMGIGFMYVRKPKA